MRYRLIQFGELGSWSWLAVGLIGLSLRLGAESELIRARSGHETRLTEQTREEEPLTPPPSELFELVKFDSEVGKLSAYLGLAPGEGKHPAIIWLTGGFPVGGIGSDAWGPVDVENDQSAKAYREAGIVMMYPTMRGAYGNPGVQESFYGEVHDVLAALDYLKSIDYVDPERIYLGGHSTGGTLALLAGCMSSSFAGIIAFGPVSDVSGYGADNLTYNPRHAKENRLRAPIRYLDDIQVPTWMIEGEVGGNGDSLLEMQAATDNPKLQFIIVEGADHFDVLSSSNARIAEKIASRGPAEQLEVTAAELQASFESVRAMLRESTDLYTLGSLRGAGVDLSIEQRVEHYLISYSRRDLEKVSAVGTGWEAGELFLGEGQNGRENFILPLSKKVKLNDLEAVFAASAEVSAIADRLDLHYYGWDVP